MSAAFKKNGPSAVDAIKDRLTIDDVVGSYVKLEKSGKNFKARCPFHNEKTPSFYVTPDKGIFKCFGCGKGGDLFSFIQEIERVEFREALVQLADRAGVDLKAYRGRGGEDFTKTKKDLYRVLVLAQQWYQQQLTSATDVQQYLAERGLTPETIKDFVIGYAPAGWTGLRDHLEKNGVALQDMIDTGLVVPSDRGGYDRFRERIMFPINDGQGRTIAFSGRIFVRADSQTDPDKTGKYINSPEGILYDKSKVLFGYDRAKQSMMQANRVVIVEGQMDLIGCHQAGTIEAVALSGTALTPYHVKILNRFTDRVILALDGDSAGLKAAGRSLKEAFKADMEVLIADLPEGSDPSDLIQKNPESWKNILENTRDYVSILIERAKKYRDDRRSLMKYLHAHVYEYIHLYLNPLLRDEYMRQMSAAYQIDQKTLQEDFGLWEEENNSGKNSDTQRYPEMRARDRWDPEDALVAILSWLNGQESGRLTKLVQERLNSIDPEFNYNEFMEKHVDFKEELSLKMAPMIEYAQKNEEIENYIKGVVHRWGVSHMKKKISALKKQMEADIDNQEKAREFTILKQRYDLIRNEGAE